MNAIARVVLWLRGRHFAPAGPAGGDPAAPLLGLHNRLRLAAGAPPLRPSAALALAARRHAAWMAANRTLGHAERPGTPGFTGAAFADRIRAAGRGVGGATGENVAAGQDTAERAAADWAASPGHRRNMLGRGFRAAGFGVAVGRDGVRYWCAVFAAA